jgi:hypothetical protein
MTQASYTILEGTYVSQRADTFAVHLIRVPYDIERAIQQAAAADMPELDLYAKRSEPLRVRASEKAEPRCDSSSILPSLSIPSPSDCRFSSW